MFRGVLFDLDGVITDTAEYHFKAWKQLANTLDIQIDRTFNESLKGISREDSLTLILKHGKIEQDIDNHQFKQLAKEKNDLYVSMIQSITPLDIYPGVLPLLCDLKQRDIKIALASASKNGPLLLEKMDILSYFDAIVDPTSVHAGKPAPDIFIAAADAIGIPVTECIGIEDSKAGITAIKKSGAFPIGVGSAKDLENDISLIPDTSYLTLDYLTNTWEE